MPIDSTRLLNKLEPAVRPVTAPAPTHAARAPFEEQGFDQLLALVSTGSVRSERPVTIAPGADLTEELDEDALAQLASAADVAEASGARKAIMLFEGRGLLVDITDRSLTDELRPDPDRRLVEIDAAVYVAGRDREQDERESRRAGPMSFPGTGLVPPGVARQLEAASRAASPELADNQTSRPSGRVER